MQYIQVIGNEAAPGDLVEVPLESNQRLLLSTLQSMFVGAIGLKFKSEESNAMRAVRLVDSEFHPPVDGWAGRVYQAVVNKEVPTGSASGRGRPVPSSSAKRGPGEDEPPTSKRARENCYRCGGTGHIADMCTSAWDSKNMDGVPECYLCQGKGHIKTRCPNTIPRGMCYKCHGFGHSGRDCKAFAGDQGWSGADYSGPGAVTAWTQGAYAYGGAPAGYGAPTPGVMGLQVCYRCQQPGHRASECPRVKEQGLPMDSCFKCGREGHKSKECNVCYVCKNQGHVAIDCPNKTQQNF